MVDKGTTLAIVLLIAGLIVGAGIGYFAAPRGGPLTTVISSSSSYPLQQRTIKLGYISSTTAKLETDKPYLEQIIIPDINKQMQILGLAAPTFHILIDDAQSQDVIHLEKVQGFRSIGVTIFQSGGWSSMAQTSLDYCNTNGMLMWSSRSTSPALAVANDYLFRMCPTNDEYSQALAEVMWSYGIKSVIIFQISDSESDEIVNSFKPAWLMKGGDFAGDPIRYSANTTNFSKYLQQANMATDVSLAANNGDYERVGVLLLSRSELGIIVRQAVKYPSFYNCPFFGGDRDVASPLSTSVPSDAVNKMRVFRITEKLPESSRLESVKTRFESLITQQFTSFNAFTYDVVFVSVYSILMTQSVSGRNVQPFQTSLCEATFGVSGWCELDEYGDRKPLTYDVLFNTMIWSGVTGRAESSMSINGGVYYPGTRIVDWNTTAIATYLHYTPKGP